MNEMLPIGTRVRLLAPPAHVGRWGIVVERSEVAKSQPRIQKLWDQRPIGVRVEGNPFTAHAFAREELEVIE